MSPLIIKYCELIEMGAIGDIYIFNYYLDTIYIEIIKAREFVENADKKKFKEEIALYERVYNTWKEGKSKLEFMKSDKQVLSKNKDNDDTSDNVCMICFT